MPCGAAIFSRATTFVPPTLPVVERHICLCYAVPVCNYLKHNLIGMLCNCSGDEFSICNPPHPIFNEVQCKARFPEAYAITYWTHTW